MFRKAGILLVMLFTIGCAQTTQYVPFPDQNKIVDDPTKGRIYVIRPTRFAFAVPMEIFDEGKSVGQTLGHSYLSWERPPGNVTLQGKAENTESLLTYVKEGRRTYIHQSIELGILTARNSLTPIDEETAKNYLSKLKQPQVKLDKK